MDVIIKSANRRHEGVAPKMDSLVRCYVLMGTCSVHSYQVSRELARKVVFFHLLPAQHNCQRHCRRHCRVHQAQNGSPDLTYQLTSAPVYFDCIMQVESFRNSTTATDMMACRLNSSKAFALPSYAWQNADTEQSVRAEQASHTFSSA